MQTVLQIETRKEFIKKPIKHYQYREGQRYTYYRNYRYRRYLLIQCHHGTRWVRYESGKRKAKGCKYCASEHLKKHGVPILQKPFYNRIFQPKFCPDCGIYFETLYPTKIRCNVCRDAFQRCMRRFKSKCLRLGVPFEAGIGPIGVFTRDNWTCWICGQQAPKELRGTHNDLAPELEHKIELTAPNSLGHVWNNVACAHRKCNKEKQIQRSKKKKILDKN